MKVEHYQHGSCETVDFVESIIVALNLTPAESWAVGNALKYACRAGFKGDWKSDALKCADFIKRAMDGEFLSETDKERFENHMRLKETASEHANNSDRSSNDYRA